jgi:putative ABC transport system substrate-binding protein
LNTRRKLIIAFGAGALTAPLASFAQPSKVWRIGYLGEIEPSRSVGRLEGFKAGLSALGYTEGKDYMMENRFAQSDFSRLPVLATELVTSRVDIIISAGTPSAVAAHQATREIPILIATAGDPVGSGLAASLARPGENVTGLTGLASELDTKRLDLLRQLLPQMRRVGLLYDPENQGDAQSVMRFEADCGKLGLQPIRVPARKPGEIAAAFMTLARYKAQGLIVTTASTSGTSREMIIQQAAKHRLAAIYGPSNFADAGGLMSYAADPVDLFRRTAAYADKIFKGAKPGDLPIEQPTKFELVINMKTARALRIKIPNSVLVQATQLIE